MRPHHLCSVWSGTPVASVDQLLGMSMTENKASWQNLGHMNLDVYNKSGEQ